MDYLEPDFAAFLHNPFGFPSKYQKEAMKYFKDMQESNPDYRMSKALYALYNNPNHFGNPKSLHKLGLRAHYKKLKTYVIENNFIGLIVYGANINNNENISPNETVINVYTTQDNNKISLDIQTISRYLLKEYCEYYPEENKECSEVDTLCKTAIQNLKNKENDKINHRRNSPTMIDKLINRKNKYTKKEVHEKREKLRKICMKDIGDGNEILVQGNGPYSYTINIDTADDETIMKLKSLWN